MAPTPPRIASGAVAGTVAPARSKLVKDGLGFLQKVVQEGVATHVAVKKFDRANANEQMRKAMRSRVFGFSVTSKSGMHCSNPFAHRLV